MNKFRKLIKDLDKIDFLELFIVNNTFILAIICMVSYAAIFKAVTLEQKFYISFISVILILFWLANNMYGILSSKHLPITEIE